MIHDYFLRCRQADRPVLMALAQRLGVLRESGGGWVAARPEWVWVPIGPIGPIGRIGPIFNEGLPALAPDGEPWWHANLRLTLDLREHAQALYAADPAPELADALANIGRFFIVDAAGRAARPALPAVDFA